MTTLTMPLPRIEEDTRPRFDVRRLWWVPLALILIVQCLLTVRQFSVATNDEGRYLEAGHALIHEFWHGGGSPYFETYFSGAPDIYSPLAAMAQYVGGFAAVRLMSTVFMLTATTMMFLTGRRLFGYWAAVASCGLYAGLYITQAVGRNVIYDAMAMMVLSVAAYCASRAERSNWLLAVAPVLVFADFTKYVMIIFNPAVIAIAAYQVRKRGWTAMAKRCLVLGATTVLLFLLMVFIAGTAYWKGMLYTTFGRHTGANALFASVFEPARFIVNETFGWFGAVIACAFLAVAFSTLSRDWTRTALLGVLSFTSVLVALEGIHLHSNESMGRHSALAAWFGCLAAGYLLAGLASRFGTISWRVPASACCGLLVLASGYHYSFQSIDFRDTGGHATTYPAFYGELDPYMRSSTFHYLVDGDSGYMLETADNLPIPWWNLTDDNYIKYPIPGRGGNWHWTTSGITCTTLQPNCQYLTGPAGYIAAIKAHSFAMISLHRFSLATDKAIIAATKSTPGYVLLTTQGGGPTWIYLPDYEPRIKTTAFTQPLTTRCVITVTKHFTAPPGDAFYIKISHPCTGQKARVQATCLHYVNGATTSRAETGRWVSALGARSTIYCRLGAYTKERWQRMIDGKIYTTYYS